MAIQKREFRGFISSEDSQIIQNVFIFSSLPQDRTNYREFFLFNRKIQIGQYVSPNTGETIRGIVAFKQNHSDKKISPL